TCRAPPPGFHRRPAHGVPWCSLFRAAGTPAGEQPECARQVKARRGQLVGEPGRSLRVGPCDEQTVLLQMAQALAENVGSDIRHLALELTEAPWPVEQRRNHEQRPAV